MSTRPQENVLLNQEEAKAARKLVWSRDNCLRNSNFQARIIINSVVQSIQTEMYGFFGNKYPNFMTWIFITYIDFIRWIN